MYMKIYSVGYKNTSIYILYIWVYKEIIMEDSAMH